MIRQREFLSKNRRRTTLVAFFATLVLALSAEHSGLGHEDSTHDDATEAISMCLGIIGVWTVLLIASGAVRRFSSLDGNSARSAWSSYPRITSRPVPRVRAGPQNLQVFRL